MDKPFAITLDSGSSLANKTGAWRTKRPLYVDRLPLKPGFQEIMGVNISKVSIPVAAGRNLAVLTEAAVRNYVLQLRGIDSTRDFIERQAQHMKAAQAEEQPTEPHKKN